MGLILVSLSPLPWIYRAFSKVASEEWRPEERARKCPSDVGEEGKETDEAKDDPPGEPIVCQGCDLVLRGYLLTAPEEGGKESPG